MHKIEKKVGIGNACYNHIVRDNILPETFILFHQMSEYGYDFQRAPKV